MKKLILFLICLCIGSCAYAQDTEAARDYALWLEQVLPGAAFEDAEVPGFIIDQLGADYDFIARQDAKYGGYIAGVRRADAPALPDDVHQSAYGGSFETRVFQAVDNAGNIYYEFALADGVHIRGYDGLEHLVIWVNPDADTLSEFQLTFDTASSMIFNAASPKYRAQMFYAAERGFSLQDERRSQLCFPVHNIESWRAGATDQPFTFYLDVTPPADVLGDRYLEEEDLIRFTRIPIGLYLQDGKTRCELVISQDGTLGVETDEPHRLYEAGPGCEALVNLAEKILGYRPGEADFLGKECIRATLEWLEEKWTEYDNAAGKELQMGWDAGSITIRDAEKLDQLDEIFSRADFTVGSVNCPSKLFLTMEYSDGSRADFAVAINSFDLFFRNGMYFTAGNGELIDLFDFKNSSFWKGCVDNEPYVQG